MRKIIFVFTLLFLVLPLISVVSAIEFNMKTNFSQGETLIAKISGNFIDPPLKENILFYRGHVRIAMEPEITKIDGDYYIYASLAGKNQNNYSILIENVKYMDITKISDEDLVKNFSISSDTADFLVKQGFIVTENDFVIEVQNIVNREITLSVKIAPWNDAGGEQIELDEDSLKIKSGEIKKINFKTGDINFSTIKISNENTYYEIPVYIYDAKEKKDGKFRFEPGELNISLPTNSNKTRIIYIKNTGDTTIEEIILTMSDSLKPYIDFSVGEIEEIKENSSFKIELYIVSKDEEKNLEGQIIAKNGNTSDHAAVFLNFIKDYVPLGNETEKRITSQTCEEAEGVVCGDNKCIGEIIYAADAKCCLDKCEEEKKPSSTGKIIGWFIILAIFGYLAWFFKKRYRGTIKKEIDLVEVGKKGGEKE